MKFWIKGKTNYYKKHWSYRVNLQNWFAEKVAPPSLLTVHDTQLYSNVTPLSDKKTACFKLINTFKLKEKREKCNTLGITFGQSGNRRKVRQKKKKWNWKTKVHYQVERFGIFLTVGTASHFWIAQFFNRDKCFNYKFLHFSI